jgi:hypothetical protein
MRPETSDKRLAIGERCTLIRWIWCGVRGRALENSATAVRDVAKLGAPWALHASSAKLREALHLSFSNGLGTIYDFT